MQLHILQRQYQPGSDFDPRPNAVQKWLEHLPVTNVGETTRLLYRALCEMNAQDLALQTRYKALELLRPSVCYVLEAMKKHIVGQSFPLPEKARKVAHLSQELLGELGDGYKIVIMQEIANGGHRDAGCLTTAIQRTLRSMGHQLLKAYQIYAPYPQGVWADIHQLYEYARRHDLHLQEIEDAHDPFPGSSSIENIYKQILLLALACPYRMRQGEVEQVYAKLTDWAAHSQLQPLVPQQPANGLFVVDLNIDEPPTYLVLRQQGGDAGRSLLLDSADLAEDIRQALADKRDHKPGNTLTENALRRLMLAWGVMPKRRFSRNKQHAKVSVAMGLSATHYFVGGEAAFSPAGGAPDDTDYEPRPQFQAEPIHAEQGQTPPLWELEPGIQEVGAIHATAASNSFISTSIQPEEPEGYDAREWKMINVSAGGYCLLWDSLENSRAQVGELVGLREQDEPDSFHWRLGVIRWMKSNTGLELGVQMLSPGAVAVGARPYPATSSEPHFTRALLLPEIPSLAQPATLLMPSPPFRLGGDAIVYSHGREVKVKLTKLVENTGTFAQFQFTTLETGKRKEPTETTQRSATDSEFDDLWDSI